MSAEVQASDAFQSMISKRVPMRRWGEASDFAGIAVYLMSAASSFHTGDTFLIDGGYAIY
jgi:NAD(P)-dependent dehydrogenase (short-subunit alcohol dehydrogenase family)